MRESDNSWARSDEEKSETKNHLQNTSSQFSRNPSRCSLTDKEQMNTKLHESANLTQK